MNKYKFEQQMLGKFMPDPILKILERAFNELPKEPRRSNNIFPISKFIINNGLNHIRYGGGKPEEVIKLVILQLAETLNKYEKTIRNQQRLINPIIKETL